MLPNINDLIGFKEGGNSKTRLVPGPAVVLGFLCCFSFFPPADVGDPEMAEDTTADYHHQWFYTRLLHLFLSVWSYVPLSGNTACSTLHETPGLSFFSWLLSLSKGSPHPLHRGHLSLDLFSTACLAIEESGLPGLQFCSLMPGNAWQCETVVKCQAILCRRAVMTICVSSAVFICSLKAQTKQSEQHLYTYRINEINVKLICHHSQL